GDGFLEFALAQGFLAGGIALHSGSATALHFDTLSALGREDDYEDREAVAERWSLVASACAAAVGGLAGTWNLRAAYV
ncbi:MAG: hypothetical protein ABEL76_01060, partial [Bradymonadaceae bacterium]